MAICVTTGVQLQTGEWGPRLRGLRVRRGPWLSQERLAAITGVSVSMISRLERGEREPSLRTLEQLAPGYGLPVPTVVAALFGDVEAPAALPLPEDPLQLLTVALERGPWPQNISAAVYALLASVAYDRRQAALACRAAIAALLAHAPDEGFFNGEELVLRAPGAPPPTGREWLSLQLEALYQRLYPDTPQ